MKFLYLLKSKRIKNFIYVTVHYCVRVIYCFFRIIPIDNKSILVSNYCGKGWGDNPKYVAKKIKEMMPDSKIYWLITSNVDENSKKALKDENIISVQYPSIRALYYFSKCRVWISNARLPLFLIKKNKQKYYQLWHGGCGPKKIEKQAEDKLLFSYILRAKNDSKMMDLAVSNSEFNTNIFQNFFWYNGEILKCGSPRHDVFFYNDKLKNEIKEKIYKKYGIRNNSKIILYAPTFRSNKDTSIYKWDYFKIKNKIEDKFKSSYTFLFRLHPNISYLSKEMNLDKNIIDVSLYDDMQELIAVSDIIITDYSGIMMQAALAKKTVLLYIPDLEDYRNDRGFNIDLEATPFVIGENIAQLSEKISALNIKIYSKKQEQYLSKFNFYDDGNASFQTAKKIISDLNKEEK